MTVSFDTDVFRSLSTEPQSLLDHDTSMDSAFEAVDSRSSSEARQSETPQPSTEGDKKPTKKRKSWGQELPTPKTNLPPRKRAKTEDEKEQRRIERVLRNRAAAQSSRERKRKEVEGLEEEKDAIKRQNASLAVQLRRVELENQELSQTVAKMAAEMTVFRKMIKGGLSSPDAPTRQVSPTLSVDLMPSTDSIPDLKQELRDFDFSLPAPQTTVDPRDADFSSPSESPRLDPVAEMADLTQHPAAMLCDLQCQSAISRPRSGHAPSPSSDEQACLLILLGTAHLLLATMASTVSSRLIHPLTELFRSLRTGCPISKAATASATSVEALVPLIHWLISTPTNPLSSSARTKAPTSTPSPTSQARSTFRVNLLRRLLACSPALARPLRDATGRALRLMSSTGSWSTGGATSEAETGEMTHVDSLRAMFWAIESIERSRENPPGRENLVAEVHRLRVALDEVSRTPTAVVARHKSSLF